MIKEEAIKYLKEMKDDCNDTIHKVRYVTKEEVLEMAIKALEQEPSGDVVSRQIEQKCDRINSIASVLPYTAHREIQELLCEIMDLYKAESEDKDADSD